MNLIHANAGVIPPVPTILDQNGHFDRNGMKILIDSLINKGVHGLFFLGTAGEFSQFSAKEREDIAEFCIDYTNGRLPVWIGTGSNNTPEAIRLTGHAAKSGATGVVVINPYYSKLSEETLFSHYASILEATEIPLMLYNFPALTGQDLSPAFVSRLAARYPNVVGIKETVDQLSHIRQMILQVKEINPAFSVFCGFDEYLLATLAAGGDGAIAASANFAPQLLLGVYNCFQNNNLVELLEHHRKVIEIPALYSLDEPFIPSIKEAIRMAGVPIPTFCLPPSNLWSAQKEQKLKEIFNRAGVPLAL
ncbi:dihydrodipicolinate synthase family protein [Paenibacillus monticola]|uniref:Dihydrodipicolinate synthase family protein n=1 Tax=Paenibacillus monticola TaxID=2666075 RepID=A0A7X2H549_9BACL|nr:dihydrodipicolinate synthase family protein [Paenibacillus monticola]MRN53711.1 dihydrodipicolinate synthase family protein [Paenibacillus monticola]